MSEQSRSPQLCNTEDALHFTSAVLGWPGVAGRQKWSPDFSACVIAGLLACCVLAFWQVSDMFGACRIVMLGNK